MTGDKQGVKVVIAPAVQFDSRPPTHAALMGCRQCGATMVRGTQCERCGAWCR